jgi:hypothetical protein
MNIVAEWKTLADDVRDAGLRIFETASVPRTHKGFGDEKALSLMLLARTKLSPTSRAQCSCSPPAASWRDARLPAAASKISILRQLPEGGD